MRYYKGRDATIRFLKQKLNKEERKRLIRLISRIAESSYRRGAQQMLVINKHNNISEWILKDDAYTWRFEKSLERSIGLEDFETSSEERLYIEEADVAEIKDYK